ncbi:hypothetical protein [Thalassorhabdomicrobium marinisediminis]|uniref:D-galactarate dehydratase n=1 Tax=Thalassorhabdomicrobium marinisediminis TaxID=2170577 RepID=A0A2T7FY06_9RHOB|nr:hypothetical protein [Thalassorhabdomicrobium marinisediminis]PVA07052.1 hypothetical protein DC363_07895 [Thalassorhabdomicrobium marinisediminis]
MKYVVSIVALAALGACADGAFPGLQSPQGAGDAVATPTAVAPDLSPSRGPGFAPPVRPTLDTSQTRPDFPPPPPPTARTVEQFDTTSAEDRAAATAAPSGGERRLGTTIASLGSPTDPGIWFKTPLVSQVTQGRVEYQGTSVNVELRPSGGAAGSGSQISLAAMRLLGAPLTGLPEVTVYDN